MTSWPRYADLPISHMPMQPSTQVTHMPEAGTIDPSVRFLVRVAAEEFTRDRDMTSSFVGSARDRSSGRPRLVLWRSARSLGDLAGHAGLHVAEHVVEAVLHEAGRREVGAGAADGLVGLRVGAAQLTRGTDVGAAAALAADLRAHVERGRDAPVLPPTLEADRPRRHLLLAHAHAEAAQDALLVLLLESLLAHLVGGGEVLDDLGLRAGGEEQLEDHLARPHHSPRGGAHHEPLLGPVGAGGDE